MGQSGIARAWRGSETDSKAVELRRYAWCCQAKECNCNDECSTAKAKQSVTVNRGAKAKRSGATKRDGMAGNRADMLRKQIWRKEK